MILDLKNNSFSALFFALPNLSLFTFSEKGSSGCVTPKEDINRISSVDDEEHFLDFC